MIWFSLKSNWTDFADKSLQLSRWANDRLAAGQKENDTPKMTHQKENDTPRGQISFLGLMAMSESIRDTCLLKTATNTN